MEITLHRCNNIEQANISVVENTLNIKYAINGTGKTTISHALQAYINDKEGKENSLGSLKPFKYLAVEGNDPEVIVAEELSSIKVFDENFVNEFVFLPDELLKGSFDILIRDEDFEQRIQEIESLVKDLREMFNSNDELNQLIVDLSELSNSFGPPTKSGIHGSSSLSKAFKKGNIVHNIPTDLMGFKEFIQGEKNFKWVKWQIDGKDFLDISSNCPYCTNNIEMKRETIRKVSEEYDAKTVENINNLLAVFQRLMEYFSEPTKTVINNFAINPHGYSSEQIAYLVNVKTQIDILLSKVIKLKNINFSSLKDVDKVIDELTEYKINLGYLDHLKSKKTENQVEVINSSVDSLLEKAGKLQGAINRQKEHIKQLIEQNKSEINEFLDNAGYRYSVSILDDQNGIYKLKLNHKDIAGEVANAKSHLSFGERNAFALVLFVYDAIKAQPDLIVLDDPISSFDKNKKFAIVNMLFRKPKFLREKTVVFLTHDFEPIVDMVYHHSDKFNSPTCTFLENNSGNLIEKQIEKSDIKTFIDISLENIEQSTNSTSKLVYLRRLFEITGQKGCGYQLLSNLFHKRAEPKIFVTANEETVLLPMSKEDIEIGEVEIQKLIPDFDYSECLSDFCDDRKMKELYSETTNNYEKLHVFRIIFDDKPEMIQSDIIQKFINEAFHIENDYIYQINPRKYQLVPQYVIDACDNFLNSKIP